MHIGEIVLEFEDETVLDAEGERAGLIVLGSMLLSFLLIRVSTRLMRNPKVTWWPGSIKTEGGLARPSPRVRHRADAVRRLPARPAARQPLDRSSPPPPSASAPG